MVICFFSFSSGACRTIQRVEWVSHTQTSTESMDQSHVCLLLNNNSVTASSLCLRKRLTHWNSQTGFSAISSCLLWTFTHLNIPEPVSSEFCIVLISSIPSVESLRSKWKTAGHLSCERLLHTCNLHCGRSSLSLQADTFIYRCACRSCSRSACSGQSSTRRTCTRSAERVSPRVCCNLGRSTAGCSHPARSRSGCSGVLWFPRRHAADPLRSNSETCWWRWAAVCRLGPSAGPSSWSSSWSDPTPGRCVRTALSGKRRRAQMPPSSSSTSSPRRSRRLRDNGSLSTWCFQSPTGQRSEVISGVEPPYIKASLGPSHLSSGLAVVLVHGDQRVPSGRRRVFDTVVDEPAAEPGAVLDVVWAAAPVPALCRWTTTAEPRVAAALRHVALTAGPRDGVDQSRSHHRVDKRGFLGSCWTREGGGGVVTSSSAHPEPVKVSGESETSPSPKFYSSKPHYLQIRFCWDSES